MADQPRRHPIIVDTDALIAVANTDLWPQLTETLALTTTNVCLQELRRHVRETSAHAPAGTRDRWLHDGSEHALEPFEETTESFSVVSCVPRPHGEDAGEQSIQTEVEQHTDTYRLAILMDKHGRRSINRVFDEAQTTTGRAVAPPFLLYLLFDAGVCTEAAFCEATETMLRGEGWTSYQAIQAAWEAIPVDCSSHISSDLIP